MIGRLLAAVLMVTCALPAFAESLNSYIQARRDHGVTAPLTSEQLDAFLGDGVIEISGVVKGNVQRADAFLLIVDRSEGSEVYVSTPQVPGFLRSGNVPARLLIRAKRERANALLDAELILAISEGPLAEWEAKRAAEAAAKATPTRAQTSTSFSRTSTTASRTTSRGGGRPSQTLSDQPSLEGQIGSRGSAGARVVSPPPSNSSRPIQGSDVMTERVNGADGLSPEAQAVVPIYADFIVRTNSRVRREDAEKIAEAVIRWSLHFGLDPRLVMAVALTESTFNHSTRSHAGAMGLLQLMPGTARYVGVNNAWDLEQNVYGGVKYLREQLDYFIPRHGQERGFILAIAAYNAGPGAVRRFNGVPPYRETQNYVERVTRRYRMLTGS